MTDHERQAMALCESGLLTVAEVAELLRLGRSVVYRMMADGTLPYTVVAGRRRRIPRAAVLRVAAQGMRGDIGA